MSKATQALVNAFKEKAELVAAKVTEAADLTEALHRVVQICEEKAPCELLAPEPGTETGPLSENKLPTRAQRLIAAPGLSDKDFAELEKACEGKGFLCVRKGLRKYLAGFDVGLAWADFAVAASGTCAVPSTDEEVRLSTMICESSVLLLRKSTIKPDLTSIAPQLRAMLDKGKPGYTAFITGPSRTADIERVLAVGVHGPLELHVILLEG
ncbi:MAG: lactate utilization protein [Deltaproteobacteria bacterium]|jgi:L-lactate dehydrogenase complex protein LldG|nr:lactate utilization protein [Deltaproteobacteria bacterium]